MKTSKGSGGTPPFIVMVIFTVRQLYFRINSPAIAIKYETGCIPEEGWKFV
jgi:hypothetical protein